MKSPSQILITGGAGFIGSHLVERLLRDGASVAVIDDCSTGRTENLRAILKHPRFRLVEGRVSDCALLEELVASSTQIYHLAAAVGVELVVHSPVRTIQTNLHETEVLLEVAAKHKIPVLLTSTSEVYGKSLKPAFEEEDDLIIGPPHLGRWSYACSKLMDEFLALAFANEKGLPVVIVRLFNTVGPRQTGRYGMVLPRFIAAAKSAQPLRVHGNGHQTRCFCFVEDTVEALIRLLNCPEARGQVFNIGSTEEVTILDLAERIIRTFSSPSPIEFIPYEKAYAKGFQDMLRRKPVIDKLTRFTGFRPSVPLQEIIERTGASI